ncbi:MAG: tRNA-intron lyase [Nanoarchaeota archaeon]
MQKIKAYLIGEGVSTNESEAFSLYKKSVFGEPIGDKIQYTLTEAMFLVEKGKLEIYFKNRKIKKEELIKKFQIIDKKFSLKYVVFNDLREKGYVVKTALKFGADFRVYEKCKRPGKEHAKWIVFVDHEANKTSWQEFSAKNRVAHSTKKNLLIAIVDEELDVSYYEVKWIRP